MKNWLTPHQAIRSVQTDQSTHGQEKYWSNSSNGLISLLWVSALHYSTKSAERFGGVSNISFSLCTAPTYYLSPSISDLESGTSEVNLRQSVALIEVSIEFRLKLIFWKHLVMAHCVLPTCYEWVHCTTQPEVQKFRGVLDVSFSSCAVPIYYLSLSISDLGIQNLGS